MKKLEEIKKTRNLFIKAENELPGLAGYYYDSDDNCINEIILDILKGSDSNE